MVYPILAESGRRPCGKGILKIGAVYMEVLTALLAAIQFFHIGQSQWVPFTSPQAVRKPTIFWPFWAQKKPGFSDIICPFIVT